MRIGTGFSSFWHAWRFACVACLTLNSTVLAGAEQGAGSKKPAAERIPINRDYHFQGDIVRNKDGTITWFYLTNHVASTQLAESMNKLGIPKLKAETRKRDSFRFVWDAGRNSYNKGFTPKREAVVDENLLILTLEPSYKDIVEEFLERFDTPVPQVYIKARIVEVTLDSKLEYGASLFFDKSTALSSNPNTFFRSARTSFRPPSFSNAFQSEGNSGVGIRFDDVTMDTGTLTLQLEALQERGVANILSEPGVIAMQGQRATLITGEETPVAELTLRGTSETVTTRFKETGIRLDFTPLHIGREFVKMRVRPEVSSITGFITTTGNVTVQNPVIAQRNAETVVTVRDGMTLVIGGLYAVSEIRDKSGIPILGDLPVLGFLFSRTRIDKVKSELSFFITPYILHTRLDKSVFVPPRERKRLREKEAARK